MIALLFLTIAVLFTSYSNGANDNFKGVATLYGGRVLSYKNALRWATFTTFAGALTSFFLGGRLLKLFTGKGLVLASIVSDPAFLLSVSLGAALTVFLATILAFPISTTHGLVGGLLGAGIASGGLKSFHTLGSTFFLPLALGPLAAAGITMILYWIFHDVRKRARIESNFCLCIGNRTEAVAGTPGLYMIRESGVRVEIQEEQYCRTVYSGRLAGLNVQRLMNAFHVLSAGAVGFARGLNDAPKITAALLVVPFLPLKAGILMVAVIMAIGGLIHSKKIAKRMSFDITRMNPGQAFTGNLVSGGLVIAGSIFGLPLSTTHVSCGSIFGIGIVSHEVRKKVILQILGAWITTLPLAAAFSAMIWLLVKSFRVL